jgi:DNA polymerase III epsilon subunit family exonuclease
MTPTPVRTPIAPDTPLADLEFVAFDTETTGAASATGRMVEIGAVRFRLDGTELDRFTRLVNPLRPIPPMVTRIHGITDAMVRDCPPEPEVLPEFLAFLGDPGRTVLMAHNARFDMAFVGGALRRAAVSAPPHAVIDTVRLSRRRAAGLPSHSLRSLVRIFGVGDTTEHRGLSDSVALKQVFLSLAARPPALATAGDLFALAPAWHLRAEESRYRRPADEECRTRLGRPARSWRGEFETTVIVSEDRPVAATDHQTRLGEAITAGRSVDLVYDGGRSAGERRRVTPLRIVASVGVTYLLAFCHTDRKQKQYRLDRIREVNME